MQEQFIDSSSRSNLLDLKTIQKINRLLAIFHKNNHHDETLTLSTPSFAITTQLLNNLPSWAFHIDQIVACQINFKPFKAYIPLKVLIRVTKRERTIKKGIIIPNYRQTAKKISKATLQCINKGTVFSTDPVHIKHWIGSVWEITPLLGRLDLVGLQSSKSTQENVWTFDGAGLFQFVEKHKLPSETYRMWIVALTKKSLPLFGPHSHLSSSFEMHVSK